MIRTDCHWSCMNKEGEKYTGLPFSYEIRKDRNGQYTKALGDIRGVTYIYGVFYRFGLIDVPDKVKEKMGHSKKDE